MSAGDDMLLRVDGRVGRATLNRPKALNALSYDMAMALEKALDDWRDDPAVSMVLIDAAGEKAFCAGGDIALMQDWVALDVDARQQQFRAFIERFHVAVRGMQLLPKPVIASLHGAVAGAGLSN